MKSMILLLISIACLPEARPQTVRNFSGRWILNLEKSDTRFRNDPRVEIVISQATRALQTEWKFPSDDENARLSFQINTDGTTSIFSSGGLQLVLESMGELGKTRHPFPDIQVSGRLKGRELAVRFKWFEVNKHVVEFDDVWKLSPDGNTLSIDRASELRPIPIEVGQHHEVFVFERAKRGVK